MARQYQLPQVIVQQDFALVTAAAVQELLPVIVGPQKKVISLDDADDANYVSYGDYNPTLGNTFAIKGLNDTEELYSDSVVVTLKNVHAAYATITGTNKIEVGTSVNKISLGDGLPDVGFVKYLASERASVFANRDVKVGDRLSIDYGSGTLNTRVLELIHDVIPANAGTFSAAGTNAPGSNVPVVVAESKPEFSGVVDTVYEVRVVKGGTWAEGPKVLVMTNNGTDSYAAQTITGASAQFNLGTLGLKATFNGVGTGLTLGDIFTVEATAQAKGPVRTIRMADSLPSGTEPGLDLSVTFSIFKPSVSIPSSGYPQAGDEAWTISSDKKSITIGAGLGVLDSTWVDGDDNQVRLDVLSGDIYVEYKALVKNLSQKLTSFSSLSSVNAILGEVVPENPLAYAVHKALLNSGGHTVYAVAVETDDIEGYASALEATEGEVKAYYIVPLTKDESIIQLVKGHVLAQSEPEKSMERIAIVNMDFNPVVNIYFKKPETDERWSGYVSIGSGLAYNLVTIPGATLLSDGVRVGDKFRSNFAVDAYGTETYQEFTITNIIDEEHLELETPAFSDLVGSVETPSMIQIVRVLTKDEQAIAIGGNSSSLGSRRVVNIWPDYAYDGEKRVEGYFIAAAVAGLKSSVAPHQPLTNVILNGFTDLTRSSGFFTPSQLNKIANGGTWIVTKVPTNDNITNAAAGAIVTRHQLTTDYTDDNMAEVSVTTNLDSIAKWLRDDLKVIIGQYNNHPYMIQLIRTRLEYRLTYLQGHARTQKAGPQLISYKINKVVNDELIRTRVNADVDLTLPYPINVINLKLTVV